MKIKLFYPGVFFLALLIGCSIAFLFSVKPMTSNTVAAVRQTTFPDIPAKVKEELEVFDVDRDFFDKWPEDKIEVLETGKGLAVYELKARSGDDFLSLVYEHHGSFLRRSKVKVAPSKKIEGVNVEWDISVDGSRRPRFLIRNSGFLRPGKVETAFSGFSSRDNEIDHGYETSMIRRDAVKELYFNDTQYSFSIRKGLNKSGDKIIALIFSDEETDQVINLLDQPEIKDEYLEGLTNNLLWAGDLDSDQKLDFYMEVLDEKGGYGTWLFLSSKAEKGKLVKLVGAFSTLGC